MKEISYQEYIDASNIVIQYLLKELTILRSLKSQLLCDEFQVPKIGVKLSSINMTTRLKNVLMYNVFNNSNFNDLDVVELSNINLSEFKKIRSVGKKTISELTTIMREYLIPI